MQILKENFALNHMPRQKTLTNKPLAHPVEGAPHKDSSNIGLIPICVSPPIPSPLFMLFNVLSIK